MFRLRGVTNQSKARTRTRFFKLNHTPPLSPGQRFANREPLGSTAPAPNRSLFTTPTAKMASDEDYMAFLNKANRDVSGGGDAPGTSASKEFKAMEAGDQAPQVIRDATKDAFYTSDADEPFKEVSLKYEGDSLPDEVTFASLIAHWNPDNADITIMDPLDWDRKGNYGKLLDAVREASKGNDVRVYRVPKDGTRVEYWLVSRAEDRIVGVKAMAVES